MKKNELSKRDLHDIFNNFIDNEVAIEKIFNEWDDLKSTRLRKKKIDKLKSIIKTTKLNHEN